MSASTISTTTTTITTTTSPLAINVTSTDAMPLPSTPDFEALTNLAHILDVIVLVFTCTSILVQALFYFWLYTEFVRGNSPFAIGFFKICSVFYWPDLINFIFVMLKERGGVREHWVLLVVDISNWYCALLAFKLSVLLVNRFTTLLARNLHTYLWSGWRLLLIVLCIALYPILVNCTHFDDAHCYFDDANNSACAVAISQKDEIVAVSSYVHAVIPCVIVVLLWLVCGRWLDRSKWPPNFIGEVIIFCICTTLSTLNLLSVVAAVLTQHRVTDAHAIVVLLFVSRVLAQLRDIFSAILPPILDKMVRGAFLNFYSCGCCGSRPASDDKKEKVVTVTISSAPPSQEAWK